VKNTGASFGSLQGFNPYLTFLSVAVLAFIAWQLPKLKGLERAGILLILAGIVSNLTDRLRLGFVVDFLDFKVWPVFNLADSFITAGVSLLLFASASQLLSRKNAARNRSAVKAKPR